MNRKKIFSILLASALTLNGDNFSFCNHLIKTEPTSTPTAVVNPIKVAIAAMPVEPTTNNEDEKSVKISKEKAKEIAKGSNENLF